jgi:hypothetical protein
VLLTVPSDKAGIKTEVIAGLKPMTRATSGDTATGISLPVVKQPSASAVQSGAPASKQPAPAVKQPVPVAKPKG